MRRLPSILAAVLLLTQTAFAAEQPKGRQQREIAPRASEGPPMVLHPAGPLTDTDRAELASRGIFVKHALTGGRYLARVGETADLADPRVVAIEPLTPEMKIHPSARREAARGFVSAELHVIFQRDISFDDARQAILAAGGTLTDPLAVDFQPSYRLDVIVPPAALAALAADDRVLTVVGARRLQVETHNALSAEISNVDDVHAAPYGLTGEGVTVSLFELAEAQRSHVEFGGRLNVLASGGTSSDKSHATHVAGTIAAAGVRAEAKGMAPNAKVHQFCVATGSNTCTGTWLSLKKDDLASRGIVADNNSWGYTLGWSTESGYPVWKDNEELFGAYDLLYTAPIDDITIKTNVLFVHSAGNDGSGANFSGGLSEHRHVDDKGRTITDKVFCYSPAGTGSDCPALCTGGCEVQRHHTITPFDTMGLTAAAKNVITVGNIAANRQIVGSSSRGPAKDGRIKPDVVARGFGVLSSVPTDVYDRKNGTSMAAPVVTGIAALITEQWRRTFSGADPLPSHIKAVIIAGAEDLGNPGPDYTYGFGLVDAKRSIDTIIADEGLGRRIRNLAVSQGQVHEFAISVAATEQLRVVLNWPDRSVPGLGSDAIASKALLNNLDLKVIDSAGNVHLPYVLDKTAPTANATRGVNTVDNVEMVEIADAAPGAYRVVVTGTNVPDGPQAAVVVASARVAPPCVDLQEPNETPETAHGNLVPGQTVRAAVCTQDDVDFFRFTATQAGPVTVTITTNDTAVRATLSGTGVNATVDVPANSTATLTGNASSAPLPLLLRFEPLGAMGAEPTYRFVAEFPQAPQPKRRSVR